MKKSIINLLIYLFFPGLVVSFFTTDMFSNEYTLASLIAYILLVIYFIIVYRKELIEEFKRFKIKDIKKPMIIFIIGICFMILLNYIINYIIIPNGLSNNEELARKLFLNSKILYFIMLCFLIPFIEEIVFRFGFKKSIKNNTIFLIVSSSLFGLLHIAGSTSLIELLYFIPYFVLGYTLGKIYLETDNILYSFLFHAINNIITAVVVMLL